MRFTTSFLFASGLLLAGTATALAWPATTRSNANVRGGPGINYNLLGTLPAGSPVEVVGCAGAWCQTAYGYVSANLLVQAAGVTAAPLLGGTVGTAYRAPLASPVVSGNYIPAPAPLAGAAALGYAPAGSASATLALAGPTDSTGTDTTMAGARTTIGTANVRSGPGTEYDVVKTLPDFTKVEVTGCANGWCQTNEGYISLYLLSRGPVQQVLNAAAQPRVPGSQTRDAITANAATAGLSAYGTTGALAYGGGALAAGAGATTTANANVRSGPGVTYNLLGTLPAGAPVTVVSCAGAWCQTQYGYVSARLITQPAALSASPVSGLAPAPLAPTTFAPTTFAPGRAYAPAAGFPASVAPTSAPAGAVATAGGAAYSATTTQAVNLRTGPGTGYDVLATLPAGTTVGVRGCTGSWCETVDGYVSARHLSSGEAIGPGVGQTQPARVVVRRAPARATAVSPATYADPMLASDVVPAGYEVTAPYPGPIYPGVAVGPAYPVGGAILAGLAAPFIGLAAAVDAVDGGYGYGTAPFGYGWGSVWRASWGPGYWGPGLYGRNGASYWGARTSYWGGRPSYSNMHPGYPNMARFGDRNGDTYWSRRGEGRLPQRASFYSGLGPRWQGPYAAGPSYNGRPVMWRPGAARW